MTDAAALEDIFARISEALDEVGAANQGAFLAKLALLLCHEVDDPGRIRELVASAKLDLADPSGDDG